MLKTHLFRTNTAIIITLLAASCSSTRPTASNTNSGSNRSAGSGSSIQFINDISIKPDGSRVKTGAAMESGNSNSADNMTAEGTLNIEKYSSLQFKYAILEDARVEDLHNIKLLSFMDDWYGTRYHYGGTTKSGIDCSAFAYSLMTAVYGVTALPRTSKEQYDASRHISRDELQEGDLVFFHTLGKHRTVTHVGVYLRNNKFIHASISGVMISDMNDGYYDKHYVGAGRVIPGS